MPKGIITDEHKKAMKEGRERARAEKIANGEPLRVSRKQKTVQSQGKPKLYITGKEKDALDFFPSIRESLRPLYRNKECDDICIELSHSPTWQNVRLVLNRLQEIFDIVDNQS